jgi:reactive intermediate/imine deaminase
MGVANEYYGEIPDSTNSATEIYHQEKIMSQHEVINTKNAPLPLGTYSQAIKCNKTVYFAGQIPLEQLVGSNLKSQITQVFENLAAVAQASGGALKDIVKLTIYLIDLTEFHLVNEVMSEFFTEPYPARTTIGVAALPMGAKVEIEGVMLLP